MLWRCCCHAKFQRWYTARRVRLTNRSAAPFPCLSTRHTIFSCFLYQFHLIMKTKTSFPSLFPSFFEQTSRKKEKEKKKKRTLTALTQFGDCIRILYSVALRAEKRVCRHVLQKPVENFGWALRHLAHVREFSRLNKEAENYELPLLCELLCIPARKAKHILKPSLGPAHAL